MSFGILGDARCRPIYEKINQRELCDKCQAERSPFAILDKKGKPFYSNLLPGFSSPEISIPVDVLIVAEAHGGGRHEDFRPQKELDYEISWLAAYYLTDTLRKFHQAQMRVLLQYLDTAKKSWAFTDLIKCFVWHGFDKKSNLDGEINWATAIKYCRGYLDQQIDLLQPRKILGLGGTVAKYFELDRPQHGSVQRINNHQSLYVHSIFPSQWTADQWIAKKGWEKVIQGIAE